MTITIKTDSETKVVTLTNTECNIYQSVSLSPFTSYRVGGKAQWYAEPKSWNDIQAIFTWLQKEQMPFTCLGGGSNLLISDRGIEGLVLNTRHLKQYLIDEDNLTITVGAGYPLPKLAWKAAKKGWQGLDWAVGIPGTVGGAVVMNAGAHKGCMADIFKSAIVAYSDGRIETLSKEDLEYSYRSSRLQKENALVLQATLNLESGQSKEEMMALTTSNFKMRKQTQPYDKPSCGSVFRNPKPQAAGWLIEQIGLKGHQIGGAQVAHRHANFILNAGNATARDIFNLIQYVQEKVEENWSILLHPEVKFLGQF
ncbi:UDP-N-acetylmuramate dehydrogenase [Cyanobacterium aponinum UTEX 3222]|uniref:UDP-N-acetylenolpyruvoylglucosamine reductase n=3 Tax=Cyanobacterium aponinum TaxID=379064 RepID=K9Z1A4_CYAAP|nr:UDP-N-acetylmuramate dehydrogenase [Cyanobacterium aponinum]WRL40912.1 UDP-N-acetylmuramate dehydrogenase [Cyanobacterium aponinum UTEX 3222]AFZ52944.1 UDP-N-acetylmuramate dehydrogenase [Cyanobacterium aponinum PCC 10605]MTF37751.1 UDP-N-acetylmuramate dehydrogenase [Cyanobacterium aponinum 0216]WPF90338.1 UDP-N-acetylmuramate dehydrogenase [Cyanobacterium aponinum AL20115]WRL38795.1 UDP-N-acetylmuramate dehydrogenase [Cyanobacterium aponinum UTEX 3221]